MSNVKIEPLVDGWYAWPQLLSPAQRAMNLAFRYLPLAKSFVASPAVHVAASQDSEMAGGQFLNLPLSSVPLMEHYIAETESLRKPLLEFASDFKAFAAALQLGAKGYSLEEWYTRLPPSMCGLVDLAYDLSNNPKVRLLEEIVTRSYLASSDGEGLLLHRQPDHERPFFLSTPRISVDGSLFLPTSLASDRAKRVCAARRQPTDVAKLAADIGVDRATLDQYFSDDPPAVLDNSYQGPGLRVRYFGHACVLLETSQSRVLIDPMCTWDSTPPDSAQLSFGNFPDSIDLLCISHAHQDHFAPEVLLQLRDRVKLAVVPSHNRGSLEDASSAQILRRLGYDAIAAVDPMETIPLADGSVTALPFLGEHADLDIRSKQCLLVEMQGRRIGFFVDSDANDMAVYQRLSPLLNDLDAIFVGMECNGAPLSWLYGPLSLTTNSRRNDNSRRLSGANCNRAWRLAEAIRPKRVFIYAMGQEPWMQYLMGMRYEPGCLQLTESDEFIQNCLRQGIPAARLYEHMEAVF